MCGPTYPVYRSATVLRAERDIGPEEAVQIAEKLRAVHEVIDKTFEHIVSTQGPDFALSDLHQATEEPTQLRVRLFPAITIDFAPRKFSWKGTPIEFRPCITVCIEGKRAKIWTRFNCATKQNKPNVVRDFYLAMKNLDQSVQSEYIKLYNEILRPLKNSLKPEYHIQIRMVSTKDEHVRDLAEKTMSSSPSFVGGDNPDPHATSAVHAEEVYGIIAREFGSSIGDRSTVNTIRKIVTFNYPRNQHRTPAKSARGAPVPVANEDFNAVGVVDIDDYGINILGLAYEKTLPRDFRKSAPHIVSGEISYQVGNSF